MEFLPIVTFKELLRLLQIFFGVVILYSLSEILRRRFFLPPEFTRKFIHISVGVFIFFAPLLFVRKNPVLLISGFFTILDFIAIRLGLIPSIHSTGRRSYGTTYYPLALFILTMLLWERSPWIVTAAMMMMIAGDAAGGILGALLKRPRLFRLTSDKKSVEGSLAVFLVGVTALGVSYFYYANVSGHVVDIEWPAPEVLFPLFGIAALYATAWEAISSRGLDNLTIPLSAALILFLGFGMTDDPHGTRLILATLLSIAIAIGSWKLRLLSPSGSVAAYLLAMTVFAIGAWKWTLPLLFFFLLSSMLSRMGKQRKAMSGTAVRGDTRDHVQVAANGGIPGAIVLLSLLYPHQAWYLLFAASVAAVTADTWSSEIGMLGRTIPRNILTWKSESAGTSGAVTWLGFMGGVAGAAVIAIISLLLSDGRDIAALSATAFVLIVIIGGTAGNLIDSILGAALQAGYRCRVCGKMTERKKHCDTDTHLVRGLRWFDNDVVNVACGATGAGVAIILWIIL